MKKILTSLLVLFSLTVNSQVIDWDNFDSSIADSVYFVEMNKFRDSLGLLPLTYSKISHDNISLYVTNQNVKEDRIFHPDKTKVVEKYNTLIEKEIVNALDINTSYNPPLFVGPWEVGSVAWTKQGKTYHYSTYSQLTQYLIKLLCSSKPHHKIITKEYGKINKAVGIGSASIQLAEGDKLYTTFHIWTLYYN
jgi:hypothetical protein|tara:strand:- start:1936 stop:2514 length:579 start_codon:yes stop_codon:yes gene_type:complete